MQSSGVAWQPSTKSRLAQYYLGGMYAKGSGVSKDDSEAVKWFRKAAMQNDPAAQTNLGVMYLMGRVYLKTKPKV